MRCRIDTAAEFVAIVVAATIVAAGGCGRRPAAPPAVPPAATAEAPPGPGAPFVPPTTLAALTRQVTWIDRPVRDPRSESRELDAGEPASEALALPNDSPEANARILAALTRGRAPGATVTRTRAERRLASDVDSLNPVLADTVGEFDLLELTGVSPCGFDRDLEPFANADVVTSWQSSADGLVDKIVLRDDLSWSDGRIISAHDVVFSWRVISDRRVPARAFRDAARRIRLVHAYDDHTVVFFHAEPAATSAWDIDLPLLPRHAYARTWELDPTLVESPAHADLEARPVTGGAYEVVSRTPGREVVLRRRPAWSSVRGRTVREPPRLAEIRFRVFADPDAELAALEAGELDEAVLSPRQWATATSAAAFADRAVKVMTPEWRSLQFAWNLDTPFFGDRRVRRAMAYAFDHGRLIDGLGHGLAVPAAGVFAPGSWTAGPRALEPCRQDLDKAEALLDEAGWIDHDGDGTRDREIDGRTVPLAFAVMCDRQPHHTEVGGLLRDCLARIGVTCMVRSVAPDVLREHVRKRRFEACLVSWGTGVDPDTAESLWRTDGPRNACGYANPEVDRLFAEARRERDRGRRAGKYARIEEILWEDQPATWLSWRGELRCFARRIEGEVPSLRGPAHWTPGLSTIWKPTLE